MYCSGSHKEVGIERCNRLMIARCPVCNRRLKVRPDITIPPHKVRSFQPRFNKEEKPVYRR